MTKTNESTVLKFRPIESGELPPLRRMAGRKDVATSPTKSLGTKKPIQPTHQELLAIAEEVSGWGTISGSFGHDMKIRDAEKAVMERFSYKRLPKAVKDRLAADVTAIVKKRQWKRDPNLPPKKPKEAFMAKRPVAASDIQKIVAETKADQWLTATEVRKALRDAIVWRRNEFICQP